MKENIFNKERILAFDKKYNLLSEENKNLVLKATEDIEADEKYKELCFVLLECMQKGLPTNQIAIPDDGSLKSEFALFFPVWHMAEEFAKDAEKRGIGHEVIHKTLRGIDRCLTENKVLKGRPGTSAYRIWLPFYGQGKLFRIGDFEFELIKHEGKDAISVHIPAGIRLNVQQNLQSFQEALDFYERYYSEYKILGFVCKSWMLNPHIEEIMGRKTNISRFGDMFDRFDIGDTEGKDVYRFVYKLIEPCPVDELSEETSLQRNIKEYLKVGNKVLNYGGFISKAKLKLYFPIYGIV